VQNENHLKPLRKQLKTKRLHLSHQQQNRISAKIATNLRKAPEYLAAKTIALYLPVNGEADPRSLVAENTDPDKKFYLPVLSPQQDKHLLFARWNNETQFVDNIYNIPEPILTRSNQLPAKKFDLIIMPLLGFDKQGNRLGMGGGYYDRTFSFKQHTRESRKPFLLAYAYAFQECQALSTQPWDIPFDAVVTEEKFSKT
jgi:5-formyltetrahydrofolate cyclo-ligase